ncbi:PorP/SprF family type IX secretion system membrane protein [Aegicerativicinus sediminis]|uniref:PorP/SprF family type IX secretion system membrane protein n=1 Tax=Aegicerativicinus sediminis TaxID=2893202 RepID=UPI001E5A1D6E|nr:PorP/SprF family type IX secretion system membrane protein [Aegicerativicinus sediminis]
MKPTLALILIFLLSVNDLWSQEDPYIPLEIPAQNMLKFNRFRLNPTFSTVRENKSYINAYHRNQWIEYNNNYSTYLLSYSGRVGDKTGLGLSLYQEKYGVITNFGVLANYAYGVRVADNSVFTIGFNLSYYSSKFNESDAITSAQDPLFSQYEGNSLVGIQPGFNLAIGNFDVGLYAENLFDYNFKTQESVTDFPDKTFTAHLQYTWDLKNAGGIMEGGRLLSLARGRKPGKQDINLSGSLVLDLPRIGWLQGGYDDFYGASVGVGFNLGRRISVGYTYEKGLSGGIQNFGGTHEVSFAYSFQPNLTENMVFFDDKPKETEVVAEVAPKESANKEEIENLRNQVEKNNGLIDQLYLKQDSIGKNRMAAMDQRFTPNEHTARANDATVPTIHEGFQGLKLASGANGQSTNIYKQPTEKQEVAGLQQNSEANTVLLEELNAIEDSIRRVEEAEAERLHQERLAQAEAVRNEKLAEARKEESSSEAAYKKALKANKIKNKTLRNIEGVADGYYIVVNVFSTGEYFDKFTAKLAQTGIDHEYFTNKRNNWKYVYLKRFDSWREAIAAYRSNVDGTYTESKWVMRVDNGTGTRPSTKSASTFAPKTSSGNQTTSRNTSSPKVVTDNLENIDKGYYVIAGVFTVPKNADKYLKTLNSYGLNANSFIHPKNKYRYIFIGKEDAWNPALQVYQNNLTHQGIRNLWIMRVNMDLN